MSFVYSSNSPYFLDYLASCKTREEILNDPELCVLLNDPHIKDNMELALLARAADYGSYADKVEFVGFLLANGPELDTDTIMHYRKKILLDYTYSRIAKEEFSDMSKVDKLRVETYGKDTTESNDKEDDGNCFKNPCDYLAPISSAIGMLGDSENFKTISNIFARNAKESQKEKEEKEKEKKDSIAKKVVKTVKDAVTKKDSNEDPDKPSDNVWGNIRKHVASRIIPEFNKGYRLMLKNMSMQAEELKEDVKKANLEKETQTIGDSEAEKVAENIAPAVKINIFANMGDCARLWEHMRRLNLYDPNKNAKGPIDDADLNTTKSVQGTPKNAPAVRNDTALKPKNKETKVSNINTSPKGGRTREEIVEKYLETNYSTVDSVEEVWNIVAEKYGWKNYEAEKQMHSAKHNNKNPYKTVVNPINPINPNINPA